MNRGDVKLIIDRCVAHDVPDAADLIERQAAQIEQMRQAIQALENDSEECLDFDECTAVLVPIDTFHALIDAMVLSPDQALEQFAAKVREQCAQMLLDGSFLHDQSPAKLLSIEAAKAIRAIKELP